MKTSLFIDNQIYKHVNKSVDPYKEYDSKMLICTKPSTNKYSLWWISILNLSYYLTNKAIHYIKDIFLLCTHQRKRKELCDSHFISIHRIGMRNSCNVIITFHWLTFLVFLFDKQVWIWFIDEHWKLFQGINTGSYKYCLSERK